MKQKMQQKREYKRALPLFIVGYVLFVLSGGLYALGDLAVGLGQSAGSAHSPLEAIGYYTIILIGFLTAVVPQFWYLGIKPYYEGADEIPSDSHLPKFALLIVFMIISSAISIYILLTVYQYTEPTSSGVMSGVYEYTGWTVILTYPLVAFLGPLYAITVFVLARRGYPSQSPRLTD